jgi:hypothetical protein
MSFRDPGLFFDAMAETAGGEKSVEHEGHEGSRRIVAAIPSCDFVSFAVEISN